jgi:signal transduction histidine kinase
VRELVDVHQGSIDVQSALGDGTTVTVRLPLQV